MNRYNPKEIEAKWQKIWQDTRIYETDINSKKPKSYVLDYFPYPSGVAMHMGHVRNYTISDTVARYERMKGHEVLHPMGWDSFGLPAENYAIKNNISPREAIDENTRRFKKQFEITGMSYDWSREIDSSSPEYYKWTQWFFLMLHKRGLAYRKNATVNWCPSDKTVLANEQVIVKDGVNVCERCGAAVEKKDLAQWFFKITDYADRLIEDLDDLNWPEKIKKMQINWIGKSTGAEIDFKIDGHDKKLKIFTTRPDTLYGATFMVLAPEHPFVDEITSKDQKAEVESYVKKASSKTELERKQDEKEKTGAFTGAYGINPVNGEKIPIWVSDFVLMSYGEGAIMAVPGHDQRDFEFAKTFDLPIKYVVEPTFGDSKDDEVKKQSVFVVLKNPKDNKVCVLNWGPRQDRHGGNMLIGGTVEDGEDPIETARREITEETGFKNVKFIAKTPFYGHGHFYSNVKDKNISNSGIGLLFELENEEKSESNMDEGERGKFKVEWHTSNSVSTMLHDGIHQAMFDYLVLNKVYYGEGVMTNSDENDGLSSDVFRERIVQDLTQKKIGSEKVNYKLRDWLISRQRYWGAPIPIIHCEKCGEVAVPDDQLPVELPDMADYKPKDDGRGPLARAEEWVNTKCPECGNDAKRETDTMDGFACSSWYFLRFVDPKNDKLPADKEMVKTWLPVDKYIGGAEHAVMHLLYARFWTKVMFDEGYIDFKEPFAELRNQGMLLAEDGQKISKRLGNYIPPESLIENGYGADSLRATVLFLAPYDQDTPWSNEALAGLFRFIGRVWQLVSEYVDDSNSTRPHEQDGDEIALTELAKVTDKTVRKVTQDLDKMNFNTAIAAMMELVNSFNKLRPRVSYHQAPEEWRTALLKLLKLMAPIMPHVTEELWEELGMDKSIHLSEWPVWDEELIKDDVITIVVQINGKVRANILVPAGSDEESVVAVANEDEVIKNHLAGGEVVKTIYVPGRLVNFVVR